MNFMEYVCRGIVRSEDAICRLNKNVVKLAKCTRSARTSLICLGVAGIMTISIVAIQDQEIKALQNQGKDLNHRLDIQEELKEQKGA